MDPLKKRKVLRSDFEKIMESLARGKMSNEPTIMSESYINHLTEQLIDKGCIEDDKVYMEKLKVSLENKEIDINIFNKPLWNEIEDLNF